MNMFFIRLNVPGVTAKDLSARLKEQNILCGAAKDGSPVMRLVTHYGIEQADIDRTIDAFAVALGAQQLVAATA
jgi:threonine aldolase